MAFFCDIYCGDYFFCVFGEHIYYVFGRNIFRRPFFLVGEDKIILRLIFLIALLADIFWS